MMPGTQRLADPMLPDLCAAHTQQSRAGVGGAALEMTSLGRFLGDHAPAVLKDILLGLGNRISVATGLRVRKISLQNTAPHLWVCPIEDAARAPVSSWGTAVSWQSY